MSCRVIKMQLALIPIHEVITVNQQKEKDIIYWGQKIIEGQNLDKAYFTAKT